MPENKEPLQRIVGLVSGSDPVKKNTTKGELVSFRLQQRKSYDQGDDAFYQVTVWNEKLQPVVLAEISRGDQVVVEGYFRPQQGDYAPDFTAFRVGRVEWLRRETLEPTPNNY